MASTPVVRPDIRHKDSIVAYFCNLAGEIMLAPDTRMSVTQCGLSPLEWRRCEAVGAHEIDQISKILSRQLWEKKRNMTAAQHLREKKFVDQMRVNCRIRIAQSFSEQDELLNRKMLERMNKREDMLISSIVADFDPGSRTSGLAMEVSEESLSPLRLVGAKHQGIS